MGALIEKATATRVPCSGTESTLSSPPTEAARSCMLWSPNPPARGAVHVEPAAVVLNDEPEPLCPLEAHPDVLRRTVVGGVGDGLAHDAQQVLRDLAGHLDVVGQLEVPRHAEARAEVLHRLGDGGIERLRLGDREHGDGPSGFVEGPIGRTGQLAGVVRSSVPRSRHRGSCWR